MKSHTLKTYALIGLVALVVIFAIQNAAIVEIQFLFWNISMPRAIMVLSLMIIGFIAGILFCGMKKHRH